MLWDDQSRLGELRVGRRATLVGGLSVASVPAVALLGRAPTLLPKRRDLTSGARSGEVTTSSAVLWSRAAEPGRMMVRLRSGGRRRTVRGPWTDARTDLTARMHLTDLAPGREYDAEVWFETHDGARSAPLPLSFRTAPIHAAAQSIVWSGDQNGQGWGIDHARGGMTTYRAMLDVRPDLFIHVGDTIYADEPMAESVTIEDGTAWRNELTAEVMVVAETLDEFRGRHRYPLRDRNVRDFYAAVPSVVQWDDHETCNNWWPGEIIDDIRYTERRADVLATRGRRAWQEYQPVPVRRLVPSDGDGFVPTRLYRKVPRGQHLDLFLLDMRSYRGPNPDTDPAVVRQRLQVGLLGREQEAWLIAELRRSTATWKVISIDQPLSVPPSSRLYDLDGVTNGDDGPPLGREHEIGRVLSAIKRHGIRNVVWVTADVHFTAAYHHSPEHAGFTDFEPFWEFISGPLHCSPFTHKEDELDRTFGAESVFSHGKEEQTDRMIAPRPQNQHFGQLDIAASGELTVRLYDGAGSVLWHTTLEPEPLR